jgi:hypothetical protein
MKTIGIGDTVKPTIGFWKGFEGEVVNIFNDDEYEVEFELHETNIYLMEQLELI